jgi:TolB protein
MHAKTRYDDNFEMRQSQRTEGRMNHQRFSIALIYVFFSMLMLSAFAPGAAAQDWFRTGTGLGVSKPRVAVADFVPRAQPAQTLATLFSEVVRNDLDFSGIIDLASKSFYPTQTPAAVADLNAQVWANAPVNAQFLAFGNSTLNGNDLSIEAWFNDVRNAAAPPIIGRVYRGAGTEADTRKFAHQFADEIIAKLSGGVPGIASTQIAFVSSRTGNKEIWVMDYDGANQRALSSLHSISLTPRWSPDASRIAFTCYPTTGIVSAQICMYSMLTSKLITWPRFRGTNSSPAWSPDGNKLIFMSSMYGNPELFIADGDGSHVKRLTYAVGASTSAAWNPKTGQQVVFVSDRGGTPQLYTMDSEGGEVQKLPLPDMGYVIDPAWSPNGQLLAFSWRRPNGNYDIYGMDIATHALIQLTRDAGRNERPSWAPDGRHLVFESTRTGTREIWSMLADGTSVRQLTTQGNNESPNWSPK